MAEGRVEGFVSGDKELGLVSIGPSTAQLFGGATGVLSGVGEGDIASLSLLRPFPELYAK